MGKKGEAEYRGFTIHSREYWLTKDQIEKEIGCPPEDVDKIWADGKRQKTEKAKAAPTKPAKPAAKKPAELLSERVLSEMRRLKENGITEFTSTMLRDKLNLDKESGRDQIRRAMRTLEKDGKVKIAVSEKKRKQYVYRLVEK